MDWPTTITPVSEYWRLLGGTLSGGRALAGTEQVIAAACVMWRPALTFPLVRINKKN